MARKKLFQKLKNKNKDEKKKKKVLLNQPLNMFNFNAFIILEFFGKFKFVKFLGSVTQLLISSKSEVSFEYQIFKDRCSRSLPYKDSVFLMSNKVYIKSFLLRERFIKRYLTKGLYNLCLYNLSVRNDGWVYKSKVNINLIFLHLFLIHRLRNILLLFLFCRLYARSLRSYNSSFFSLMFSILLSLKPLEVLQIGGGLEKINLRERQALSLFTRVYRGYFLNRFNDERAIRLKHYKFLRKNARLVKTWWNGRRISFKMGYMIYWLTYIIKRYAITINPKRYKLRKLELKKPYSKANMVKSSNFSFKRNKKQKWSKPFSSFLYSSTQTVLKPYQVYQYHNALLHTLNKFYAYKKSNLLRLINGINSRDCSRFDSFVFALENRIDIKLMRSHYMVSLEDTRELINTGNILVNNVKVSKFDHRTNNNDLISVDPTSIAFIRLKIYHRTANIKYMVKLKHGVQKKDALKVLFERILSRTRYSEYNSFSSIRIKEMQANANLITIKYKYDNIDLDNLWYKRNITHHKFLNDYFYLSFSKYRR